MVVYGLSVMRSMRNEHGKWEPAALLTYPVCLALTPGAAKKAAEKEAGNPLEWQSDGTREVADFNADQEGGCRFIITRQSVIK